MFPFGIFFELLGHYSKGECSVCTTKHTVMPQAAVSSLILLHNAALDIIFSPKIPVLPCF